MFSKSLLQKKDYKITNTLKFRKLHAPWKDYTKNAYILFGFVSRFQCEYVQCTVYTVYWWKNKKKYTVVNQQCI